MKSRHGVETRPALAEDMPALEHVLGRERMLFYHNRLARRGVVLTSWLGTDPIAAIYVSLELADEAPVRLHLPGVPFVHRLYVHSHLRNRGFGTALLATAERFLRHHGHQRVGSGVEPDNERVIAWYRRLNYREWPYGLVATVREVYWHDGTPVCEPDTCRIFVKNIA